MKKVYWVSMQKRGGPTSFDTIQGVFATEKEAIKEACILCDRLTEREQKSRIVSVCYFDSDSADNTVRGMARSHGNWLLGRN